MEKLKRNYFLVHNKQTNKNIKNIEITAITPELLPSIYISDKLQQDYIQFFLPTSFSRAASSFKPIIFLR